MITKIQCLIALLAVIVEFIVLLEGEPHAIFVALLWYAKYPLDVVYASFAQMAAQYVVALNDATISIVVVVLPILYGTLMKSVPV